MARSKMISVIVPVYNESKRVFNLKSIFDYLKKKYKFSEIIVVNDGSTDDTIKKLRAMKRDIEFRLVSYKLNKGKGWAVKQGMLKATGDYRIFCDVDLSTPISELENLLHYISHHDVVIGTRKISKSKVIVEQPAWRKWLGKGFTFLSQVTLRVWVSDFTCGFKLFSANSAKRIFSRTRIYRWGFDSEIMFLAKKYNLKIKEVPVTWINDTLTKVKFPRDILISVRELGNILLNDWTGIYK